MDYYKILKIDNNASSKEIEDAFVNMLNMYDPDTNFSPSAISKYRKIKKAYEMFLIDKESIKAEEKETKEEIVKEEKFDYDAFNNNGFSKEYRKIEERIKKDIDDIDVSPIYEYTQELEVSYLEYILKTKINKKVNVIDIFPSNEKCSHCDGEGKIDYQGHTSICPFCHGSSKETKVQVREDELIFDLSEIKNGIIYTHNNFYKFNIIKDNDKDDENNITHIIKKEEIESGVHLQYGNISIDTNTFEPIEIDFEGRKITINFEKRAYKGQDKILNVLASPDDFNKQIYIDLSNGKYSLIKDDNYTYELLLDKFTNQLRVVGQGEDGYFGGSKGDIILNCYVCSNYSSKENYENIEYIETSKWSNMLGKDRAIGFKGKNHIIKKDNKTIILSGQSKEKEKIGYLLWPKIIIYLVWIALVVVLFKMNHTKEALTTMTIILAIYSVLANILLSRKI